MNKENCVKLNQYVLFIIIVIYFDFCSQSVLLKTEQV